MLLVETLRKKGDVVAMTGDGVNDAPAIKSADIGIAMGTGTEVAKNAGRMILTDDNFATIVHAVEEGRKVYDNLMKYVRFVLVALVAFVLTFLGATIFNIAAGQPFSAAQILWINFVVNAPIGAMIGLDKETPGLMLRRPRPRSESIMTPGLMTTVGLVGLFMAVSLDGLIIYGHSHWGNYQTGSSIALTAFIFMLVLTVFESRDQTGSIFTMDTFDNPKLNWIALIEIVLAVLLTQADFLIRILGMSQLTLKQFGLALLPPLVLLGLWELGKWIARSRQKSESHVTASA